jgi:hypothetical protein
MGRGKARNVFCHLYVAAVACLVIAGSPLAAQSISGTILGTVYDASHAIIAGAGVTATNVDQGWSRVTKSDSLGNYTFPQLPPGKYQVGVSAAGFQSLTVSDIALLVDQNARVDATLQPGAATERITVEAGAIPLLATDSNAIGEVVNTQQIRTLPLNGRKFFDLALLTTGAAPQGSTFSSVVWGRETGLALSGTRDINVSFLVDGAETRDERYGGTFQFSSVESIQEFKVQQNFVDAQYGQGSAMVSAVTASGTNNFHGAAYEFLRNSDLDARNFFDRTSPPPLRFNQFGASLGGPVYLPNYKGQDKTWFFVNYEGQRSRRPATTINTVPTVAERQGDLSAITTPIYDPLSGSTATGRRTPFPNNQIPTNRLDPISQKLLPYWPEPNSPGLATNDVVVVGQQSDYNQVTTRLDHNLSDKDRLMGRYSYIDQPYFQAAYSPLAGQEAPLRNNGAVLQYTRIVSPRAVNEFRFAYTRSAGSYSQQPVSENLDAQIGLKNATTNPQEFGLPSVSVTGYSGFGSFSPTINNYTDRFQWADDFTLTRGKHNFKAGIDFRRLRYQQRAGQDPRGYLQYQANFTNPGPGIAGGNALADYLLGTVGYWQVEIQELGFDGRRIEPNLYFQDDYKVTSRLSLTLGVRWEYNSPWVEPRNNQAIFNFATQQTDFVLKDPFSFRTSTAPGNAVSRSILPPQYNNWADRVGFVYRLTNQTIIRAGHGIYWDNVDNNKEASALERLYPFDYNPSNTESNSQLVPAVFNTTLYPDRPPNNVLPSGPTAFIQTLLISQRRPYTEQWNFDLQRTLGNNYLIDLGYMGNESHKLHMQMNSNQASLANPAIPLANQPLQSRRPYPNYGSIIVEANLGNANYNGFTAKLQKRYASGFSFLAAYTWSKAIDEGTDISGDKLKAPGDVKSYRSLAGIDTGHRFVGSYSLELPFGKGRRFLANATGVENTILGGWQVNGITTFSLGTPFGVSAPTGTPDVDALSVFANRTCDGLLPRGQRTRLRYFDTSCFSLPAPETFGNSARMLFHGPGVNNWDFSLFKIFPLNSERRTLQFRFESFNFFNHTQFNNPGSSLPSGTFGAITSAKNPRQNQLALKFAF